MTPTLRKMVRDDCLRILGEAPRGLEALQDGVVLMTGGTGFMGAWVAEAVAFLNDHHRLAIRLLLLSPRASHFATRAPHLAARKDIQLIEQNVLNIIELPDDVNWIIHAAGDPDGRSHATDPIGTLRTIARGADALLQAASRLNNLRKVLHVSSGLVYGSQPKDMTRISEDFAGGLDCAMLGNAYAEGKRVAETICAAYRSQMRLPIVTVRPFAFLGPYQLLDRPWAANNFIRDSLLGGPVRIQGDGQSVRSYMYPADMVWWLLTILARGPIGSVYNVGSPEGVSLADLAQKVVALFAQPVKIVTRTLGLNAAAATRLVPDVAWAEQSLGLAIKTDLDAAVRLALQWYRAL
jgi:dTDP-glucose 4,6-dehydratase